MPNYPKTLDLAGQASVPNSTTKLDLVVFNARCIKIYF